MGYLRVRTLANPNWHRDIPWLKAWLHREMPASAHPLRALYEEALAAVSRYPKTLAGAHEANESWDEFLGCVDAILVARQLQHVNEVRAAGASGGQVPEPLSTEMPRL